MTENEIATKILDVSFALYKHLGPGLLESVYEKTLAYELIQAALSVQTQMPVPLVYKELRFDIGFLIDLLVENKVIVELKSIETVAPVHFSQTLTYLRLTDKRLGLLMNFNCKYLKDGVHRVANNL